MPAKRLEAPRLNDNPATESEKGRFSSSIFEKTCRSLTSRSERVLAMLIVPRSSRIPLPNTREKSIFSRFTQFRSLKSVCISVAYSIPNTVWAASRWQPSAATAIIMHIRFFMHYNQDLNRFTYQFFIACVRMQ